ncbi:MAG: hypothetical protein FWD61_03920 [Phycisphaerales bacterium]|nr:hypothetical protein [Phycisphaerales bacterium]
MTLYAKKPRLINAFYSGVCRACDKKVIKGEQAWFAKHYGIRCPACGPHTDLDAPLPSKRGKRSRSRGGGASSPRAKTVRRAIVVAANSPSNDQPLRRIGFTPTYAPAFLKGLAERGPDGTDRLMWSSVSEVVEDGFADYAQCEDIRVAMNKLHMRHNGDAWSNGHTKDSLRKAISEPAPKLLCEIDAMREMFIGDLSIPTQPRRKIRRGQDWGDELDSLRFLAREPNAWERSVRESQPRRTLSIGVNLTVFWAQKPEELIYRGAAAIALADLLTQRGVNVRIVGVSVGEDVTSVVRKLVSFVELKRADMPLDISSLATAVCDIGFFRMVVAPAEFRHLLGRLSESMGTRGKQYLPGPDRMSLDYLVESGVTNREAAISWLREQMAVSMEQQEVCHV